MVGNADIVMRASHSVPADEASRRALLEIVDFVARRRDSYARILGPGAAPRLTQAVAEAFAERIAASFARYPSLPPGTDIQVTARFLAGGVLGVIGAWLAEEHPRRSPEELVEALVQCLPSWLNTEPPTACGTRLQGERDLRKDDRHPAPGRPSGTRPRGSAAPRRCARRDR